MRSLRADCSHPKKPGRGREGLGLLDLFVEEPARQAAVQPTEPPRPPDRRRQDDDADEGDGEDHTAHQGERDEGHPGDRQRPPDGEVEELGPGAPGERRPPDGVGKVAGLVRSVLRDDDGELLAPQSHPHARVIHRALHHASRRTSSALPRPSTTPQ